MTDVIDSNQADLDQPETNEWCRICAVAQVPFDRGVAALVDGVGVAVFRLSPMGQDDAEEWCAVAHEDPATGSPVMARGLVGSVGSGLIVVPTIASPLHKERYNLRSGHCLDNRELKLDVHDIRLIDGFVECRLR